MKIWNKKNALDEYQEQTMLKIEHNGCWFAFWGLLAAMMIQMVVFQDAKAAAGEWVVFMCLALYMAAACIKNGIWDRHLTLSTSTCIVTSVAAGVTVAAFSIAMIFVRGGSTSTAALGGLLSGGFTFVLCLIVMFCVAHVMRKKLAKLEEEPEE